MNEFDALYHQMQSYPRAKLRRSGCPMADTEDMLQSAMLKTLVAAERRVIDVPYAYACGILHFEMILYCRRQTTERKRGDYLGATRLVADGSNILRDVISAERRALIDAAIRKLPRIQKAIVLGLFFAEESAATIAADLHLSKKQFRNGKQHAMENLRQILSRGPANG